MTCIVGMAKDGVVHIGADRIAAGDSSSDIRKDPKVFRRGEFIIGYTTSFRMGDLLQYRFEPPAIPTDMTLARYMRTLFIDAIRTTFKDGGFATKKDEHESGGSFLVGIRGRLFEIESDYQVAESQHDWTAVGAGAQIARGAMFALLSTGVTDTSYLLATALKAAEHCSVYVRGPFHFLSTEVTQANL